MKTTQPPSTSPSSKPNSLQPSASPFPHESPTSHPESLPTARSTSTSSPAANPPSHPTQEQPHLKTIQPSSPSSASGSPQSLIDPQELAPSSHRPLPVPSRRPGPLRRRHGVVRRLLGVGAGLAILGGCVYFFGSLIPWTGSSGEGEPLLSEVRKATLRITVTERGNLESCVTVDGVCEVNAQTIKIISLVPEGTKVKKGDIVCKFDSSEIDKNVAQQDIKVKQAIAKIETSQQELEIQRNKGESDIIAATVEMDLAKLDLEKYVEGDFKAETTKQRGEIRLKEKDLREAKNKLEQYKALFKKGLKAQELVTVQESAVAQTELLYESAKLELEVKQKYDYKKKTKEFSSKAHQAEKKIEQAKATLKAQMSKATSENESARATADIEQQQFKEFLKQKDKTVIKAGQDGVVAYANDAWYDSSRQIREGATVYSLQRIFTLPDMSKMQVKLNIHESLIKKIKVGQKCRDPDRIIPQHRLRGNRHQRFSARRLDATLAHRRRQAVPDRREARRPQVAGDQARHDRRGQGACRRARKRAARAGAGRRRAQGRVLCLRREKRPGQASKSEDRRK